MATEDQRNRQIVAALHLRRRSRKASSAVLIAAPSMRVIATPGRRTGMQQRFTLDELPIAEATYTIPVGKDRESNTYRKSSQFSDSIINIGPSPNDPRLITFLGSGDKITIAFLWKYSLSNLMIRDPERSRPTLEFYISAIHVRRGSRDSFKRCTWQLFLTHLDLSRRAKNTKPRPARELGPTTDRMQGPGSRRADG